MHVTTVVENKNSGAQIVECADNYCYFVALLLILENTIRPAIQRGNKVDRALEHLMLDVAIADVALAQLVGDLNDKVRHYYADRESVIRAQYVKETYGKIHRRLVELIQLGDWRLSI